MRNPDEASGFRIHHGRSKTPADPGYARACMGFETSQPEVFRAWTAGSERGSHLGPCSGPGHAYSPNPSTGHGWHLPASRVGTGRGAACGTGTIPPGLSLQGIPSSTRRAPARGAPTHRDRKRDGGRMRARRPGTAGVGQHPGLRAPSAALHSISNAEPKRSTIDPRVYRNQSEPIPDEVLRAPGPWNQRFAPRP
jgi:hypothetical protein